MGVCCQRYATCDTFLCGDDYAGNKGESTLCGGGLALSIDECNAATCCIAFATCDSFDGCPGSTSVNKGSEVMCSGMADDCNVETCCEEEVTCFPGEAEVSVQGHEGARVDEIELGTHVLAASNFEPIIGLLHSITETVPIGAYVTTHSS